jgi:hypothetical protein
MSRAPLRYSEIYAWQQVPAPSSCACDSHSSFPATPPQPSRLVIIFPLPFSLLLLTPLPNVLHWQIHPDSPCTQPHPLLLAHAHARIVPLNQRQVRSLRHHILRKLLGLLDLAGCAWRGCDGSAQPLLKSRRCGEFLVRGACGDGVGRERELAQDAAVEGEDFGGHAGTGAVGNGP